MTEQPAGREADVNLAVRDWELWTLRLPLRTYLLATAAVWASLLVWCLSRMSPNVADARTFCLLVACGAVTVETQRRLGEPAGMSRDMLSAWWLPIAFVLPPAYALIAPILLMALYQVRVRWMQLHRRAFSAFSLGIVFAVVSLLFSGLRERWDLAPVAPGWAVLGWTGTAFLCAMVALLLGACSVAVAVKISAPEVTWRELLWDPEHLTIDVGEICTGVMLAILAALNPFVLLVAVIPVILLQRALLHDQLTAAARTDPKTGLLNAVAWEREANVEISRAARTGSPLAVMLIDLDHFKYVNDRHGHLAGDAVLIKVAEVMREQTREYDSCARFGGDEFAVLLPNSDLAEARRTATRILRHVDEVRVVVGPDTIGATVSIGVAALAHQGEGVTDLLAAADLALYRAKSAGRHQLG